MKSGMNRLVQAMAAVLSCAMLLGCFPVAVQAEEITVSTEAQEMNLEVTYCQSEARSMLDEINAFRTAGSWYWNEDNTTQTVVTGLEELTYDYNLEAIAMQRAAEIVLSFSHTRPNGTKWSTLINTEGSAVHYTAWSENIAYGYKSVDAAFTAWKEDSESYSGQGHRRNMLSSKYDSIGIACVYYNGVYYWVQEFGCSGGSFTAEIAACDTVTQVTVMM